MLDTVPTKLNEWLQQLVVEVLKKRPNNKKSGNIVATLMKKSLTLWAQNEIPF